MHSDPRRTLKKYKGPNKVRQVDFRPFVLNQKTKLKEQSFSGRTCPVPVRARPGNLTKKTSKNDKSRATAVLSSSFLVRRDNRGGVLCDGQGLRGCRVSLVWVVM